MNLQMMKSIVFMGLLRLVLSEVVEYNFTIAWMEGAPDGVPKRILAANGQFPGPTIELNQYDYLILNIFNNIDDFTSIHFHGLTHVAGNQRTPYFDGVKGVSSCGIPPHSYFTYNFTVQQYGTYWWHSHTGSQYVDGLYGPLIIHAAQNIYADAYNFEQTITIADLYHNDSEILLDQYLSPASGGQEPLPNSGVINGHGQYNCTYAHGVCHSNVPRYTMNVQANKKYRIRIINSSAFANFKFSIDGHTLTVIEADGCDTEKLTVDSLHINVAQRYSVVVNAVQPVSNYWIRAKMMPHQLGEPSPLPANFDPLVLGVLHYAGAPANKDPTSSNWPVGSVTLHDLDLRPAQQIAAQPPNQTISLAINQVVRGGINYLGFNNVLLFVKNITYAVLFSEYEQTAIYDAQAIYNLTVPGATIELIINNFDNGEHPLHLHGHDFMVLGRGNGTFNLETHAAQLNTINPLRRDTSTVPANGWLVLRFLAFNPGAWIFHCHIDWHLEAGLALVFNELQAEMHAAFKIPKNMLDICREEYRIQHTTTVPAN